MLNVGQVFFALLLSLASLDGWALAQTRTFSREGVEFSLVLPSPKWRVVSRLDVHEHVELIYGDDRQNGYLRMRKNLVARGTTAAALLERDQRRDLSLLPGYVVCDSCDGVRVEGRLSGVRLTYE